MSDEPRPIIVAETPAERPVHAEHYCEHPGCKTWGFFGFGAGGKTRWFCGEHKGDGER